MKKREPDEIITTDDTLWARFGGVYVSRRGYFDIRINGPMVDSANAAADGYYYTNSIYGVTELRDDLTAAMKWLKDRVRNEKKKRKAK